MNHIYTFINKHHPLPHIYIPCPVIIMGSRLATRVDCSEVMASKIPTEWDCSCSTDALPSVNHMLHHQTTRNPLYIHPAWWSDAHLDSLRVVIQSSPPMPSTPNILDSVYYLRLRRALPYFHSIQETIYQIACIIDCVQHPMYPEFPIVEQATPPACSNDHL